MSTESSQKGLRIAVVFQRQGGKAQAGHPALGTLLQKRDMDTGIGYFTRLFEKGCGFGKRESQVLHPYLGHAAVGPQRTQHQRWVVARGNDQSQVAWRVQ